MLAALALVEIFLLGFAVVFFVLGDPMATEPTIVDVIGGTLVVVFLMVGSIGVIAISANYMMKLFFKYRRRTP